MDITWFSIAKVVIAGLITYIFLPLFLMIRDVLLWKVIRQFLLTDKLRTAIKRRSLLVYEWNAEHVVTAVQNSERFYIDSLPVSEDKFYAYIDRGEYLSQQITSLDLFINSRSQIVGLLLTHYKHSAANPIPEWLESEYKRIERRSTKPKS